MRDVISRQQARWRVVAFSWPSKLLFFQGNSKIRPSKQTAGFAPSMIISHRHRFIFLKPRKVAGTSVEVALAQHCGDGDIVTPITDFDPKWDQDQYAHPGKVWPGYGRHATLERVRKKIGQPLWDDYFKFTIIRNPWDLVVSQYFWATRKDEGQDHKDGIRTSLKRFWTRPAKVRNNFRTLGMNVTRAFLKMEVVTFELFVARMLRYYEPNDPFYFDSSGAMQLDFLIRYEDLENDFGSVCERIGLPPTPLPSLKTKSRPTRQHYSTYYDGRTRELVAKMYHRHLEHFGYRFDGP